MASTDDEIPLTEESVTVSTHGLKNELNRPHALHQNVLAGVAPGVDPEVIWTRIIVIQEALLNVVRAYEEKLKKETATNETSPIGRRKQLSRSTDSRSRRMRQ